MQFEADVPGGGTKPMAHFRATPTLELGNSKTVERTTNEKNASLSTYKFS